MVRTDKWQLTTILTLFTLLLAGIVPVSAAVPPPHAGVPQLNPEYGVDVEVWWAAHPFNPESANHQPAIVSPEPRLNVVDYGNSIQRAIDALPPQGGTVVLPPGEYTGGFTISARNNVHIIADGGAVIKGHCRVAVDPIAHDYGAFDTMLHAGNPKAWQALNNPTRNFYFKQLTFDGEGTQVSALALQRVRDVVFDRCVFQNFRDPRAGHPGLVNGHMGLHNIWFRHCHFVGSCRWVTYLDGTHGSGMIACRVEKNFSAGFLFLTNDDFTEDYNGGGDIQPDEMRCAKYIAIYRCAFAGGIGSLTNYQGAHLLVKGCTTDTPVKTVVGYDSRFSWAWPEIVYPFLHSKIIDNQLKVTDSVIALRHTRTNRQPQHRPGVIGRYTVARNTITASSGVKELVRATAEDGPVVEPNFVSGNTVNGSVDRAAALPDPFADTSAPAAPTALKATPTSYSTIALAWTAPKDNVGVVGYRIYRDGQAVGYSDNPTYAEGVLVTGKQYTYTVLAYDAAGNHSKMSEPVTLTLEIAPGQNLVRDPSFEWRESKFLRGWNSLDAPKYLDDTVAHTGRSSLTVQGPVNRYCGQSLALLPDTEYTVSVWVKLQNVTGGVGIRFTQITPKAQLLAATSLINGNSDWTKIEATFCTTKEFQVGRLDIMYELQDGDRFWADDLFIGVAPPSDKP
jgi:hypothetical protein